jgi:hypothetical protein
VTCEDAGVPNDAARERSARSVDDPAGHLVARSPRLRLVDGVDGTTLGLLKVLVVVEDLPDDYEHVDTVLAFPAPVYDVAGVDLDSLTEALSAQPGLSAVESVDKLAFVLRTDLDHEDVRAAALGVVSALNRPYAG